MRQSYQITMTMCRLIYAQTALLYINLKVCQQGVNHPESSKVGLLMMQSSQVKNGCPNNG